MKNFKPKIKFLILLSLMWLAPVGALAAVDGFVFTLNPEEVLINEATQFTIQAQEGGVEVAIPETFDIYLESDSSSGSFSSNGSNWQAVDRVTMSKNTKNKNFYYKDGELKTVAIKVVAKNRVSGEEWNLDHSVNIVTELSAIENDEVEDQESSSADDISSHSSPTPLSTKKLVTKFEVDAGRDRLAVVGSLIEFEAFLLNDISGIDYNWSFGDGISDKGKEVSHVYKYPGVYNVVLNAEGHDGSSVDRTQATVIEAELRLEAVPEDKNAIAIVNDSENEINIGGFILEYSGDNTFVFVKDTILNPGARLIVDQDMSGIDNIEMEKILLKMNPEEVLLKVEMDTSTQVLGLNEKNVLIEELTLEVERIQNILNTKKITLIDNYNVSLPKIDIATTTNTRSDDTIRPEAIVLNKPVSFWNKILVLPDRGFDFLFNIF